MGVRTNAGGGASVGKLKTALQYADGALGIDVETSSYNEICDALAIAYPEEFTLFNAGNQYTDRTGGWDGSYVSGGGSATISTRIYLQTTANGQIATAFTNNKITIPQNADGLLIYTGTVSFASSSILSFGLASTKGTAPTIILQREVSGSSVNADDSYKLDVSTLRGIEGYVFAKVKNNSGTAWVNLTKVEVTLL